MRLGWQWRVALLSSVIWECRGHGQTSARQLRRLQPQTSICHTTRTVSCQVEALTTERRLFVNALVNVTTSASSHSESSDQSAALKAVAYRRAAQVSNHANRTTVAAMQFIH
jgi:hypothetical protein